MLTNLLPALPLDGGRAVRALSSGALGWRRATRLFAWFGVALGGGLIGLGVFEAINRRINPTLFLTGSYLIYSALSERGEASNWIVKGLSSRASQFASSRILPAKWLAVSADTPVSALPAKVSAKGSTSSIVVDPIGMREMGTLHEHDLLDAMMSDQRLTVGDLIKRREPVALDVTAKAREAVWRVAREGRGLRLDMHRAAQ
jgi:stage IV sporulation protein FB